MGLLAWIFGMDDAFEQAPRMGAASLAAAFKEISQGVQQEAERVRKEEDDRRARAGQTHTQKVPLAGDSSGSYERHSIRSIRREEPVSPNAQYDAIRALMSGHASFRELLTRYVNAKCGGRASDCYRRAGLSRQLYSRIISEPHKHMVKQTVMRLCIGLRLNGGEACGFMASAGYAFDPSRFEDMTFKWFIDNGQYSIFDINEMLVRGDCDPLTIC